MSENEDLLVSIIRNDIETALYETGHLLKEGATCILENTWIRALSLIGECVGIGTIAEYQGCIMALGHIIDNASSIGVYDAFLLTTRLGIMASKFGSLYVRQPLHKLKDKVIGLFPESGALNEAGKELYKSIIPPKDSEECTFVMRVLAGLVRIWADKDYDTSRLAFEYLARKKLAIPKPKWIMPNVLDDADILWVLWGAILLFDTANQVVATSYRVFCCGFKKHMKTSRVGLLWSAFYHFSCSYDPGFDSSHSWTEEEKRLYDHVRANIRNLWQQVVGCGIEEVGDKHIWADYFPRGNVCQTMDLPHFKEESRLLKIKEGKRATDNNETRHSNPRDRWLDIGE